MSSCVVVLVTVPNREEADRLAKGLVESCNAACVNIISNVTSVYRWEGKVVEDSESLLVAKTTQSKFSALKEWILANHSHTVPEIIALPIQEGSDSYLQWIFKSVDNEKCSF